MELNRKRESELQKLQHDVEELQMQNETQLSAFRKKHQEVQNEFADQIDQLNKLRQRFGLRGVAKTSRHSVVSWQCLRVSGVDGKKLWAPFQLLKVRVTQRSPQ